MTQKVEAKEEARLQLKSERYILSMSYSTFSKLCDMHRVLTVTGKCCHWKVEALGSVLGSHLGSPSSDTGKLAFHFVLSQVRVLVRVYGVCACNFHADF